MQTARSLPCSQGPATGPYPQPIHTLTPCFSMIHFSIVLLRFPRMISYLKFCVHFSSHIRAT